MRIVYFAILFLAFCSCREARTDFKSVDVPVSQATQKLEHPVFSSDSAFSYIENQCKFGERVPGSNAHESCAKYLVSSLKRMGVDVISQAFTAEAFDGTSLKGSNIIGRLHPEMEERIVLFSHWDSRPFCDRSDKSLWHNPVMGANDGASGVAVILEVVRQLVLASDSVGVDVVFFDLEDYGQPSFDSRKLRDSWCLGSQYWSKNWMLPIKPRVGILLDMVGGSNPYFGYDEVSINYAQVHLQTIWKMAGALGYGKSFVSNYSGSIIDDHYYVNTLAGIPTIDIIDYDPTRGFPETWHTNQDVPENISKESLRMVGEVLLTYIRSAKY